MSTSHVTVDENRARLFLIVAFSIVSAGRFIVSYPIRWTGIPDSAWYASAANSFLNSFQLLIGGKFNAHSLPLYSVIISPAYFFREMGDTFTTIKLINSLIMSSAMFPVFLLARRFMPFGRAFTVALLSVMIGPMFYTFTIMAESLHYPLIMWVIYLMYLSLINANKRINLVLGFVLGLALLNKMSSLVVFVCYMVMIGLFSAGSDKLTSFRKIPANFLRALLTYRHVFMAFSITVLPYLIYRTIGTENASSVPYTIEWIRFSSNILHFDIIRYFKWFLIYLGQLNLSMGLFLLPLSTFMIIHLCKSHRAEDRIFGLSATILMAGVLALAVLQSGYNFGRLTERHFFVLTPLIFILSFMWLQDGANRVPRILKLFIAFAGITATAFALFLPSTTCWPAVDSAFIDSLISVTHFAVRKGISAVTVKTIILMTSSLLIVYASFFNRTLGYRTAVVLLFSFMFLIMAPCYYESLRHLESLKKSRFPVINWINESISRPANVVFLQVPRSLAIDHIIWNKDWQNKIYWQARERLENPTGFNFNDYIKLKRSISDTNATYIISPFLAFCGANHLGHKYGINIYETDQLKKVEINNFHIDFGTPYARQVLKKGWSRGDGAFVWTVGTQAEMDVYTESVKSGKTLVFKARPYPADQSVNVVLNGKNIGTIVMQPGWHEYRIPIEPRYLKTGKNSITFQFKHAKAPVETGGRDKRKLAVAFDWLRLEDAEGGT